MHTQDRRCISPRQWAVLSFLLLVGGPLTIKMSSAATYQGEPVRVGQGSARVIVKTDAANNPSTIAVMLSTGAMKGLPSKPNSKNGEGSWLYPLPMPSKGPRTGYSEIVIDWNPHGHPPEHIYTEPHFDFHFYTLDASEVEKISFTGPEDPAASVADTALIPPNYKVVPDTIVNKMGVHAIDTTSQEFNGKPFTTTFIYGYYKGQLIFLEPMVTRAYLLTKPRATMPVSTPAKYSSPGYYPEQYSVRYDARRKAYWVELGSLVHK